MSELHFNGISKEELLQIFCDNTQSSSMDALKQKGIDLSLNAEEPLFLTIKKSTYVQVRCTIVVASDEYLNDFTLSETKLVKVDDDPDTAYVLARDGCFSRIFERLGCKPETKMEDPASPEPAPKRRKKTQKVQKKPSEDADATAETVCEQILGASDAAGASKTGGIAKATDADQTRESSDQEPPEALEMVQSGPGNIKVTIVEPFVREDTCLKGKGKLPNDQVVEVVIEENQYDLIKAKMSINCFIQRQGIGSEMTFAGYIDNTADMPRAFLTGTKVEAA